MSLILGIDTTSSITSVALVSNGRVLSQAENAERGSSESVLGLIRKVLKEAQKELGDVTQVRVATGPGSFTGIRSGLATALGFSLGLNTSVVGVPVLLAYVVPLLLTKGLPAAMGQDVLQPKTWEVMVPVLAANEHEKYFALYSVQPSVQARQNTAAAANSTLVSWEVRELRGVQIATANGLLEIINAELCDVVAKGQQCGVSEGVEPTVFFVDSEIGGEFSSGAYVALSGDLSFSPQTSEQSSASAHSTELRPLYVKPVHAQTIEQRRQQREAT